MAAPAGDGVDDRILDIDDLAEVLNAVMDVLAKWQGVALALGLRPPQVRAIRAQHRNIEDAMTEALSVWLRRSHMEEKHGPPTWKKLVEAVAHKMGGQDPALAARIAADHPAGRPARPQTPCVLSGLSYDDGEAVTVESHDIKLTRFPALSTDKVYTAVEYSFGTVQVKEVVKGERVIESYKMISSGGPHGVCAIINNEKFSFHTQRYGTAVDEANLTQCFRYLGYNVDIYRNLAAREIESVFCYYSNNDHSKYDSFVACFLSHGEEGHIFGTDSKAVSISSIVNQLTASSCPSLAEKPKIFFIQACRSKERESEYDAISDSAQVESQASPPPSEEREMAAATPLSIPEDADFFFGNATPPGKVALRDMDHGSWYISEICRVFSSLALSADLDSMMTKVHNEVGTGYKNKNYRQAPEFRHTLRKNVYFFE